MLKLALLTTTALFLAGPAFAGGDYKPEPPKPTPPTQVQGQAQGQIQGQQQHQTAKGGAGGAGGSVTNNITTGPAGGATPAAAAAAPSGGQGGSSNGAGVSNVGNTYNPSIPAASAYSMAYATFCINAQGIGAQAPWPLPGVSFSITWMRDLCRWGHIAEMREKVGDTQGAEWARCQISEYAEADRYGTQQCPQNRAKQSPVASAAPAQRAGYIGPNGFVPYPAGYKP